MFTASEIHSPSVDEEDRQASARAMQALVDAIFERLTDAGIPYCLLRNRDAIPEKLLEWSDLDILVPASISLSDVIRLFAPFHPDQIGPVRAGHLSLFLPLEGIYLRVDVFLGHLDWKGLSFIDTDEVLAHRQDDRGVMVAAPIHQAAIVWFSKIVWRGAVSERYETIISEAVSRDPETFHRLAATSFGESLANALLDLALTHQVAKSSSMASRLRRAMRRETLRRDPAMLIRAAIIDARGAWRRMARPAGLEVALLGPDGVGKTSVAARISSAPSRPAAFGTIGHQMIAQRVLPPLSALARSVVRRPLPSRRNPLDPHGAPPLHPLAWAIRYGYYTVDQWLAYARLRRSLMHPHLVIKDRHWIELGIDAKRYRYEGPSALPRFLSRLVPEPSVVIVLDAPAEVIHARKQELAVEDIEALRGSYRRLLGQVRNGYLVNADQPLDGVVADVLKIVNGYARERTLRRFPAARA